MKTTIAGAWLLLGLASLVQAQPPAQAPQAPPVCTRAELKAAADSYVAAQKSGNVLGMAFADKVVFRENMADVAKEAGLWNKALAVGLSRSFLDPVRCRTFTEIIVTEGDHQYVLGTRLYVDQRKVTRSRARASKAGPTRTATAIRTRPARSAYRRACSTS